MIRRVIHIDEDKCNGCGACVTACHEGAIGLVDGKARLMRDDYCDGLGDCLPQCPTGAISFVEREAAAALLAVSCVTVTFCVNLTMVQDRASGARKDFDVSPVSKTKIYIGYFLSTVLNSLMVNGTALALCLLYILKMGWYMSASDVIFVILDMILLVLFGSTLSSIVSYPLKTQGQLSAVGTIVSAGYGFVCGAYMPISNFSSGLQKALSYLPGTYGTSLVKNHMLNGVYKEMADTGLPSEAVTVIRNTLDCNPVFRGHVVGVSQMYLIMAGSIVVFGAAYLLIIMIRER